MNKKHIIVVEDDPVIQKLIAQVLGKEGYKVTIAKSISAAKAELSKSALPDLIILDRRLPDGDGVDLCREIKSVPGITTPPIMFLTSKNSTSDKVLGLKLGGDDYLTKPFQVDELLARVEALLRRSAPQSAQNRNYSLSGIILNIEQHTCSVNGAELKLWPKEFELLKIFMGKPGKVISKEFLSQQIWGHEFIDTSRAIEMSIRRLRTKLGKKGRLITTVKGYGFKMQDEKHSHEK